uniref:AlNc14C280G10105 protein n=1 Tax=Albugo laibachii Nc14 TaxID=890382 RepID=F0WUV7_9STRA|nr:AlNc14C280G10105 [Albugo laibachii Nc14]|eukprot:CCA25193.1 AlNc14C280G10105 [Albugo laibachii Nc14]
MPTKAQRARMTHAGKLKLRAYHNAHPDFPQEVLSVWVKAMFRLSVVPSRMTLSRVLNNHVSTFDPNSARKTNHRVTSPELEERLLLWIRQCEQYKLAIVTDESAKLNALVFSPGWLSKFQIHHRLTSKRVHGEAASVSPAAVEKGRAALQELTRGYEGHNVINTDETAFLSSARRRRRTSGLSGWQGESSRKKG